MQRRSSENHVNLSRLLEEATAEFLPGENVSVNVEFCDLVNSSQDGPKEAAKLIRKRLQQTCSSRQTSSLWYTLILLDTCVKNCGHSFQILIMNKDYLNDIVKILLPKYNPPVHVQEKVLAMIQTWALAFRNNPEMKDAEKVYEDLKMKGVEFPAIDTTQTPALLTISSRPTQPSANQNTSSRGSLSYPQQPPLPSRQPSSRGSVQTPTGPTSAQKAQMAAAMQKLRQDLAIVSGNVRVLKDMLTILRPENIPEDDLQLMQELNRTCRAMQTRLLKLLEESSHLLTDDTIINEMLLVNDDLNNAFLRYDRFEKCRLAMTRDSPQPSSSTVTQENRSRGQTEAELISFEEPLPRPSLSTNTISATNEFSIQSSGTVKQSGPHEVATFLSGIPDTKDDLDEMENWMRTNEVPPRNTSTDQAQFTPIFPSNNKPPHSSQQSTLSSEEFDKFLDAQMRANPELRSSRTKPLPSLPTKTEEGNLIKFD
jgi:hypothetical protein